MIPKALVVDDEPQMISIVSFALQTKGFECLTASTAAQAWSLLENHRFHLAVLDIMLPHGSGLDLTQRIRSRIGNLPIMLLTARSDVEDRIRGLEAGADDYLTKPFSPMELALRAEALVRRSFPLLQPDHPQLLDLSIDPDALEATWGGRRIDLSATEVRVLLTLIKNSGEIVSHRELLNEAWGVTEQAGGREMVKTAIYRLRRNLERAGIDQIVITSRRGSGYSIRESQPLENREK